MDKYPAVYYNEHKGGQWLVGVDEEGWGVVHRFDRARSVSLAGSEDTKASLVKEAKDSRAELLKAMGKDLVRILVLENQDNE